MISFSFTAKSTSATLSSPSSSSSLSILRRLMLSLLSFVYLSIVFSNIIVVNGQQSPSIIVDKFDTSISYRTNVCDRQRALWNNTINLPNALEGLNITVVVTDYRQPNEDKFFTLVNNKIDDNDPGLFAVIMDEVARRGKFQWRETFGVASRLTAATDGNKTWTDILKWGVDTFDISLEKWGYSLHRSSLGISFPAGFWDSSIVLVEHFDKSQNRREVNLWSFLEPFTPGVWALIVLAIVFTGLLYWYFEYLDVDADTGVLEQRPVAAISMAAFLFTQQFEFRPNTPAAQIVTFSFSFWCLIVTSAYVANIFSFLSSPLVQVFSIGTIQDAIAKDAIVCVQDGAVIADILTKDYPDLNLLGKEGEAAIYDDLRLDIEDGGCHAAAHQYNSFRIYERNRQINYDCSLKTAGHVVKIISAGMATRIDTGGDGYEGSKCTSLISHVLDYHLTEMQSDGFINEAWTYFVNKIGTIECIDEVGSGGGGGDDGLEETFSLGIYDLGGIFILHACAATLSVLMALFEYYGKPPDKRRTMSYIFGIDQVVSVGRDIERRLSSYSQRRRRTTNETQDKDDRDGNGGGGGSGSGGNRAMAMAMSFASSSSSLMDPMSFTTGMLGIDRRFSFPRSRGGSITLGSVGSGIGNGVSRLQNSFPATTSTTTTTTTGIKKDTTTTTTTAPERTRRASQNTAVDNDTASM